MALSKKKRKEYLSALGQTIVRLREKKELKQYELADKLDIDVRVLRRIEKGETNVQILFLVEMSEILEVSLSEFIFSKD